LPPVPRNYKKADLDMRIKYNNSSEIFSKIEKRRPKSKVRAMKFCNYFENKVYFDVQSSNRFRPVNLWSMDTKCIREFGSRKSGHQLRSSDCKAYNWLVLTQSDIKCISLRTLIVIESDYH
jgi:hypothetical protein